jgi:hypothetical protein
LFRFGVAVFGRSSLDTRFCYYTVLIEREYSNNISMVAKQDVSMMNVLHDNRFSCYFSPEHKDSEFYTLAPDV